MALEISADVAFVYSVFQETYKDILNKKQFKGFSRYNVARYIKQTNFFDDSKRGNLTEEKREERITQVAQVVCTYSKNVAEHMKYKTILRKLLRRH